MNPGAGQPIDLGQLEAMTAAAEHQARQFSAQLIAMVHTGLGTPVAELSADIEHLMKYLMGDAAPGK